jgi:hypothetical protein
MAFLTYILIVVLFVLHQDFWWWDSKEIVLGFLPIGLAYHAVFSILAAGVWALAVKTVWPTRWEQWGDEGE